MDPHPHISCLPTHMPLVDPQNPLRIVRQHFSQHCQTMNMKLGNSNKEEQTCKWDTWSTSVRPMPGLTSKRRTHVQVTGPIQAGCSRIDPSCELQKVVYAHYLTTLHLAGVSIVLIPFCRWVRLWDVRSLMGQSQDSSLSLSDFKAGALSDALTSSWSLSVPSPSICHPAAQYSSPGAQ